MASRLALWKIPAIAEAENQQPKIDERQQVNFLGSGGISVCRTAFRMIPKPVKEELILDGVEVCIGLERSTETKKSRPEPGPVKALQRYVLIRSCRLR